MLVCKPIKLWWSSVPRWSRDHSCYNLLLTGVGRALRCCTEVFLSSIYSRWVWSIGHDLSWCCFRTCHKKDEFELLKENWKWLVTVCRMGRWWSSRESWRWWQNFQIVYQRCTIPPQTVIGLEIEKVLELQSSLEEINPAIWLSLTALKMISRTPLFKRCATPCLCTYCQARYWWKELNKLTNFHSSGWEMLRG